MLVYQADIDAIETVGGQGRAPRLGYSTFRTASIPVRMEICEVEVTIIGPDNDILLDWVRIQCSIRPGSEATNPACRLSGMWLRHKLYVSTAPDNSGCLYISKSHNGLFSEMPKVNYKLANPPPYTTYGI